MQFDGECVTDLFGELAGSFIGDSHLSGVVLDRTFVGQKSLGMVGDAFGGNGPIAHFGRGHSQPPCPKRIARFQHEVPMHIVRGGVFADHELPVHSIFHRFVF